MMTPECPDWQVALSAFFEQRGAAISGAPTLEDLCYVAGRDPRIWRDNETCDDLANSILELMRANQKSSILEVGCAAGFLAFLVAPRVHAFIGVDLAAGALNVANRLGIPNASFRQVNVGALPFADAAFDAAFCYDVFTNFPSIEDGVDLVREMLRVVRPGGRVLVGNVPDTLRAGDLPERVQAINADLEARHGPYVPPPLREQLPIRSKLTPRKPSFWTRLLKGGDLDREPVVPSPQYGGLAPFIVTYDFLREDFVKVGAQLGAKVELAEVHERNPYRGFRFNVVFSREA
jgi:SAM-dependent methyltransferase